MNYFTLFPMSGPWAKKPGLLLCFLALTGMALVAVDAQTVLSRIFKDFDPLSAVMLLFASGLFLINFSKEKTDDERVQRVRYTAQRGGMCIHFLALFCYFFPMFLTQNNNSAMFEGNDMAISIAFLMVAPLLVYQVVFQIGLRLDPVWAHTDNTAEHPYKDSPVIKVFWIILFIAASVMILISLLNNQ